VSRLVNIERFRFIDNGSAPVTLLREHFQDDFFLPTVFPAARRSRSGIRRRIPTLFLRALLLLTGYPADTHRLLGRATSEGGGWTGSARQAAGTAELVWSDLRHLLISVGASSGTAASRAIKLLPATRLKTAA